MSKRPAPVDRGYEGDAVLELLFATMEYVRSEGMRRREFEPEYTQDLMKISYDITRYCLERMKVTKANDVRGILIKEAAGRWLPVGMEASIEADHQRLDAIELADRRRNRQRQRRR